jgi:hypothetical protein
MVSKALKTACTTIDSHFTIDLSRFFYFDVKTAFLSPRMTATPSDPKPPNETTRCAILSTKYECYLNNGKDECHRNKRKDEYYRKRERTNAIGIKERTNAIGLKQKTNAIGKKERTNAIGIKE